ncbi:hypothetical protein [Clostridioides difficile]
MDFIRIIPTSILGIIFAYSVYNLVQYLYQCYCIF